MGSRRSDICLIGNWTCLDTELAASWTCTNVSVKYTLLLLLIFADILLELVPVRGHWENKMK